MVKPVMRRKILSGSFGCFVIPCICLSAFVLSPKYLEAAENDITRQIIFEQILKKHEGMTFERFKEIFPKPNYRASLSFDPLASKYFNETKESLSMTKEETAIFKAYGVVTVDHARRKGFAETYYEIYGQDLPVLITTDSILHALHKSYSEMLKSLEANVMAELIASVLETAHLQLDRNYKSGAISRSLSTSAMDVDIYLAVARNLLAGAPEKRPDKAGLFSSGLVLVPSLLGQNDKVQNILEQIKSLELQYPGRTPPTEIYGGRRYIDYSQFRPRGHYSESAKLANYFRAMMWLGRADTGWFLKAADPQSGIAINVRQEATNAALLTLILKQSGGLEKLQAVDDIISFMVGKSDNLTVLDMKTLLSDAGLNTVDSLADIQAYGLLTQAIKSHDFAEQKIRSQVLVSGQFSNRKVENPAIFQLFGQRYVLDSMILSQVVYDSIIFDNKKIKRMTPSGLDVMAALGNDGAIELLKPELRRHYYSANLAAAREYVGLHKDSFWSESLYGNWLDSFRTLNGGFNRRGYFPEAMQTKAWDMKQLQTQLGSWAELRHDNILYVKQSYTSSVLCEYPAGYVEPYPEFYARMRNLAEQASSRLSKAEWVAALETGGRQNLKGWIKSFEWYFTHKMAPTMARLETMAKKELAGEPFSAEEEEFLKRTISQNRGCGGPPTWDGWYPELFYDPPDPADEWDPIIADVHTNPYNGETLEAATGNVDFVVAAINNGRDVMTYAGPVYTYYEFTVPARQRMTDEQWRDRLYQGSPPPHPEWTNIFRGPSIARKTTPKTRQSPEEKERALGKNNVDKSPPARR